MRKLLLRDIPTMFAVAYVTAVFVEHIGTLWQSISKWIHIQYALVNRFLGVHLVDQQQALWILIIIAAIAVTTVVGYEIYMHFTPSNAPDDLDWVLDDMKHAQQILSREYLATILRDLNRH